MKDDVPALLTRDEHVLTTEDVDALGGHAGVYRLRQALHGYARGGQIGDSDRGPYRKNWGKADKKPVQWPWPGPYPGGTGIFEFSPGHTDFMIPPGWAPNPDDILFPDWVPPGKRKQQEEIWERLHPRIKPLGYQFGGPIGNPLDPNDPGSQMAGAMLGGMQEQGGWVGLGASFAQMGIDIARQRQQQQGVSPGGAAATPGAPAPPGVGASLGRSPGEGLPGTGQQSGGGGGGVIGAAAGMFPGGGVMAQLATRTAKFGGQLMAIGGQGLMETFLPNGSPLGDPGASWLGRGLQGMSQVRPAGPNTAGAQAPNPQDTHVGQGGQPGPGGPMSQAGQAPLIGEMHVTSPSDSQQIARDIDRQVRAYGAGGGR